MHPCHVTSTCTFSCFYGHENKITDNINENNFQFYANKAKHVQLETQEQALKLIKKYVFTDTHKYLDGYIIQRD